MRTDWDAPVWSLPNVHVAGDGSFVDDRHEDGGHG